MQKTPRHRCLPHSEEMAESTVWLQHGDHADLYVRMHMEMVAAEVAQDAVGRCSPSSVNVALVAQRMKKLRAQRDTSPQPQRPPKVRHPQDTERLLQDEARLPQLAL